MTKLQASFGRKSKPVNAFAANEDSLTSAREESFAKTLPSNSATLLNSSKGCGYLASFGCLSKTVRRKVGRPFERRDVTAPEHENFFAVFAIRHGWQFKKEGTTVTFLSS